LCNSTGCTTSEAHQLVDYVFNRSIGDPNQELGGTMVTLVALATANGLNMDTAAETELERNWQMIEKIRAKWAAKPKSRRSRNRLADGSHPSGMVGVR
jgi:hypothetical protein